MVNIHNSQIDKTTDITSSPTLFMYSEFHRFSNKKDELFIMLPCWMVPRKRERKFF